MAKKTAAAKLTRKVTSRKKRAKRPIKNPSGSSSKDGFFSSVWAEFMTMALPGIAAYAGGKGAGWIAYRLARKRSQKLARHAGPLASVLFAVGASYATKKSERLEKYDLPIIIGSWVAAAESVLITYLPQYAWIMGDYQILDALPAAKANGAQVLNENEAVAALKGYGAAYAEAFGPEPSSSQIPSSGDDDDFADIPGLGDAGLNVGIFSGGLSN